MLSIISPTTDTSKEKPRFLREKFVIRETDKRKKVIESDQIHCLLTRIPKKFRAPGLRPKKRRAPRQKIWGSRAPVYCLLSLLCTAYCLWAMMYARENYKTSPSFSEFIALCDTYLDHLLFTNWKLSSFWMSYIEIAETVEFAESTKRGRLGAASISKKTNGSLVFRIWWSELFSLLVCRSL